MTRGFSRASLDPGFWLTGQAGEVAGQHTNGQADGGEGVQPLSGLPASARPTEAALPAALPSPEARSVRRPRRPVASVGGRPPGLPTNGLAPWRGPPAPRPCPSATAAGLLFSRQPLGQFVPGDGDPAPPRPLFPACERLLSQLKSPFPVLCRRL